MRRETWVKAIDNLGPFRRQYDSLLKILKFLISICLYRNVLYEFVMKIWVFYIYFEQIISSALNVTVVEVSFPVVRLQLPFIQNYLRGILRDG